MLVGVCIYSCAVPGMKVLEKYMQARASPSIGGGRGGTRPPTFQGGGQHSHRNCPPPLFSSEKLRGIIA